RRGARRAGVRPHHPGFEGTHGRDHLPRVRATEHHRGELSMRGNIGNILKQAQAMQENLQKAQAEVAQLTVTGESGAGMVKVTLNGKHEAVRVQIDPSLMSEDREMLEDLIAA